LHGTPKIEVIGIFSNHVNNIAIQTQLNKWQKRNFNNAFQLIYIFYIEIEISILDRATKIKFEKQKFHV
jgi:hypothetical protein